MDENSDDGGREEGGAGGGGAGGEALRVSLKPVNTFQPVKAVQITVLAAVSSSWQV